MIALLGAVLLIGMALGWLLGAQWTRTEQVLDRAREMVEPKNVRVLNDYRQGGSR